MSRVLFSTLTFIDEGGLHTVKMNFRFTPYWSALALRPRTTGRCLAQSASWPLMASEGG